MNIPIYQQSVAVYSGIDGLGRMRFDWVPTMTIYVDTDFLKLKEEAPQQSAADRSSKEKP